MRRPRLWLLSRWSGRQSLCAPITIVGAAIRQEPILATATLTTTAPPMAAFVAIEARCLGLAAGESRSIAHQLSSQTNDEQRRSSYLDNVRGELVLEENNKLAQVIGKAKAKVEALRSEREEASAKIKERNRIEQEQKQLWAGRVNSELSKAVTRANAALREARLSEISVSATQGIPEHNLEFLMKSEFIRGSLLAQARLVGDEVVVTYFHYVQTKIQQSSIPQKKYELSHIVADELIADIIDAYTQIQPE